MTVLAFDSASAFWATVAAIAAFAAVLWVALAFHVVRDARRRSTSPTFIALAAGLGFVPPFLGALIYLVIRPPSTLDEERTLQFEEETLHDAPDEAVRTRPCPSCGKDIESDFVLCPYCRTQFARRCAGCLRSLRLGWAICPYCAEEVGTHALPSRGSRVASS